MKRLLAIIPIAVAVYSLMTSLIHIILKRGLADTYSSSGVDIIITTALVTTIVTMFGLYVVHTENKQDFVPENSNMLNNYFIKNRFISFRVGMVAVIINLAILTIIFVSYIEFVNSSDRILRKNYELLNTGPTETTWIITYLIVITLVAIICLSIANKIAIANSLLVVIGILSFPFLTGPLFIVSGIAGIYKLKEAPNETKNTLEIDKLKAQIERLDLLLEEGILTEEEYKIKRNNLISN